MKACKKLSPQQARARLERQGISIAEWARREGVSRNTVYTVLQGRRLCRFGKSHEIAVKLGMKVGVIGNE